MALNFGDQPIIKCRDTKAPSQVKVFYEVESPSQFRAK
jgi:hypothetical protein